MDDMKKDTMAELAEQLGQMIVISLQTEDNDPSREHLLKCTKCGDLFRWKGLPDHMKLNHPYLWTNLIDSFEQLSRKGYPMKEILTQYNLPFNRKQISKALQERKNQEQKDNMELGKDKPEKKPNQEMDNDY
jgi:uncharacterized C2H2 Zn-finger protein